MGACMSVTKDSDVPLLYTDERSKEIEIVQENLASQIITVHSTTVPGQTQEASTLFNCNFQGANNCIFLVGDHSSFVTSGNVFLSQKNPLQQQSDEVLLNSCDESDELAASAGQSLSFAFDIQVNKYADDKQFRVLLRKYRDKTNRLHLLRDKGSYKALKKRVKTILDITDGDAELKVFMLVENSITHCYRKELQKSQEILRQALKLIPHSSPSKSVESFLIALCYLYLASLHRREGKLDLAERCMQTVLQHLEFLPMCELKALAVYEKGSILGLLAKEKSISVRGGNGNGSKLAEIAENDLRQSICIFLKLSVEDKDLYVRTHIFALCKIAIRKLKCDSTVERNSSISDACIRDARNCIKTVKQKYGQQIPPTAQIQLHIAKSDYNYRIGKYHKAQKCARRALDAAEILNMNLELSRIQHRLDAINSCLQNSDGNDAAFLPFPM